MGRVVPWSMNMPIVTHYFPPEPHWPIEEPAGTREDFGHTVRVPAGFPNGHFGRLNPGLPVGHLRKGIAV